MTHFNFLDSTNLEDIRKLAYQSLEKLSNQSIFFVNFFLKIFLVSTEQKGEKSFLINYLNNLWYLNNFSKFSFIFSKLLKRRLQFGLWGVFATLCNFFQIAIPDQFSSNPKLTQTPVNPLVSVILLNLSKLRNAIVIMAHKTIFPRLAYFLAKGTYLKEAKTIVLNQLIIILRKMILSFSSLLSSNVLMKISKYHFLSLVYSQLHERIWTSRMMMRGVLTGIWWIHHKRIQIKLPRAIIWIFYNF